MGKRVSADTPRETTLDSPTAQRILEAAERVLTDKGYSRLTLQAIEQESGEFRALVAYYFGNKRGLVQAVVDSLMSEGDATLRQKLAEVADSADRVLALLETQREISADWRGFRAFFELLPHIMHDDQMRARLAESIARHASSTGSFSRAAAMPCRRPTSTGWRRLAWPSSRGWRSSLRPTESASITKARSFCGSRWCCGCWKGTAIRRASTRAPATACEHERRRALSPERGAAISLACDTL